MKLLTDLKVNHNKIIKLEKNFENWFSLWCEHLDINGFQILYNTSFPDDPLYNHVIRIDSVQQGINKIFKKINKNFQDLHINPCIFISPLSYSKQFSNILLSDGYKIWDKIYVLELFNSMTVKNNINFNVVKVVLLEEAKIWAKVFTNSFNIDESRFSEVLRRTRLVVYNPNTTLLLAYDKDVPVGTLALYREDFIGGIYCLGTLSSYRRRGVASLLINSAISISRCGEDKLIYLQTLGQDKLEVFYKKIGFKISYINRIYIKNSKEQM